MNQLKYLVLIPVLISMLFYTSCASKPNKKIVSESEKMLMKEKITKEVQIKELTQINRRLADSINKLNKDREFHLKTVKFLKKKVYEDLSNKVRKKRGDKSVSFMEIDKVPTFPGCESGDKVCFSEMIQKHFARNFDVKMVNKLGLESGKKRVFIAFKIDKDGDVVAIKARAPHPKIEQEVIKVMKTLPRMIPGENDGEIVAVKYSIPFTLNIDKTK